MIGIRWDREFFWLVFTWNMLAWRSATNLTASHQSIFFISWCCCLVLWRFFSHYVGSCVSLKVIFLCGWGWVVWEAVWLRHSGCILDISGGINWLVITSLLWFLEKMVLSMKKAVLKGCQTPSIKDAQREVEKQSLSHVLAVDASLP